MFFRLHDQQQPLHSVALELAFIKDNLMLTSTTSNAVLFTL